ncbi:hypothetical protein [Paenibacillus wenxiniae]|uniref:Amidase n=1 Tax=Paenibacillus wenxiniae TaxID=1636843 RepID=A0ABW4RJ22_9BACL
MSYTRNNTKTIWIAMLTLLILLGGLPMQSAHAQSAQKATWLWNTQLIVTSSADVLQFASSQGVNLIYLQINRDLDAAVYHNFIAAATAKGIAVQALDGDPSWALDSQRSKLQSSLDWITSYQNTASADQRFSGIHIDIEPYLLREWKTKQSKVIRGWQQSVLSVSQTAQQLGISASADIPFWLHTLYTADQKTTLSSWMMQQYDSITIMAYRDRADAIVDVASAELAEGVTAGISVYVGVETNASAEGNGITFYEEGAAYMNQQLQIVDDTASTYSSFAGIAVHDYAGWSAFINR